MKNKDDELDYNIVFNDEIDSEGISKIKIKKKWKNLKQ